MAIGYTAVAQTGDSTQIGHVDGIVRDSAHNYVLVSATVAVYSKDSNLINFQLTNTLGEFHFKGLPRNTPLVVVATYVGYENEMLHVTVPLKEDRMEMITLNMKRAENKLPELVVSYVPPVRMNKDTLEFNADAFKLDPNAQVEDLLKKLPGVTVWGDGTITVNGKQVVNVMVNGKPFFGGDSKVIIQNIPKNAVDKVQVYQQNKTPENPRDSVMMMNIKLKNSKSFGHFGKVSAGYGTDGHYQSVANINFFSRQTQFGIVGAGNNINKVAGNISTLLRNSTYKGVGAGIEYQPDFSMQGVNRPLEGGFIFQHDFIPDPDFYKNNRLTANYFIHNNTSRISRQTQTITSLGADSVQVQQNRSDNKQSGTEQDLSIQYDKHRGNNTYQIIGEGTANVTKSNNIQQNSIGNKGTEYKSANDVENNVLKSARNFSVAASLDHKKDASNHPNSPGQFNIKYSFEIGDGKDTELNRTVFSSLYSPAENQEINRRYDNNSNHTDQQLSFSLGNFSHWILPRWLQSINTTLQNELMVNTYHQLNSVLDKDTITNNYLHNNYLSGNSHYIIMNEMPALNFTRNIYQRLADRYNKMLTINFNVQQQFYYQKNNSSHTFQNITQNYSNFIPNAAISYENNQFGEFKDNYSLKFAVTAAYPTIDQLAPLTDSINLYYIQQGNPHLKPSKKKELSFNWGHSSSRMKNTFYYKVNISLGSVQNYFGDSIIIDAVGRRTHYWVNMGGNNFLKGIINLNKAFKFTHQELQVQLTTGGELSRIPSYMNDILNSSNSLLNYNTLNIHYAYKDKVAANFEQHYSFYRSLQNGIQNYSFNNRNRATMLSVSFNGSKKLTISSNITFNRAKSSGSTGANFTIWNADASYRLLKDNNLELKFSALDLLHQNTSIINYGIGNTITYGKTNVLQQYFIFTISYFPRKFGKGKDINK